MTRCRRLLQMLCGQRPGRPGTEQAQTDADLIGEAERTRRELTRITARLAAHVAELQALTRAYAAQQNQEGSGG